MTISLHHRSTLLIFVTACFSLSVSTAADISKEKIIAVKAAHMLDSKNGRMLDHAVILIKGDRITAAGSNLAIPADAELIDLGNMTVLPGMIDAHT